MRGLSASGRFEFELAKPIEKRGEVLTNLQVYEDGGKRLYAGIFLPSSGGHWLFLGDKEGITGATHTWAKLGARPLTITVYENGWKASCANQAVMQKNATDTADSYVYSTPDCYPDKDTDAVNLECEWFTSSFKKARASYP